MSKLLITNKLSDNRFLTPEGYMIIKNCILSKVGAQEYRKNEVFSCDSDEIISINRTEEEVFNENSLASFTGKPITLEHPDMNVNPENHNELSMGHIIEVRKKVLPDGTKVVEGDIMITNQEAIDIIQNGEMTDLSVGYDCDIIDEENPQQRNIRVNHLALCKEGRAGIAHIADSKNVSINPLNDFAERPYKFDTQIPALKTAIINEDKSRLESMINIFRKDVEDFNKWNNNEWLKPSDISRFQQTIREIKKLLDDHKSISYLFKGLIDDSIKDLILDYGPDYNIWVKKNGKWLMWRGYHSETMPESKKQAFLEKYEDVIVVENGESPKDSCSKDSIKDYNLSKSDITIIEDAIYDVKRSGKRVTIKNVLDELEKSMSGFIGANKSSIIEYLKEIGITDSKVKDSLKKYEIYNGIEIYIDDIMRNFYYGLDTLVNAKTTDLNEVKRKIDEELKKKSAKDSKLAKIATDSCGKNSIKDFDYIGNAMIMKTLPKVGQYTQNYGFGYNSAVIRRIVPYTTKDGYSIYRIYCSDEDDSRNPQGNYYYTVAIKDSTKDSKLAKIVAIIKKIKENKQ